MKQPTLEDKDREKKYFWFFLILDQNPLLNMFYSAENLNDAGGK